MSIPVVILREGLMRLSFRKSRSAESILSQTTPELVEILEKSVALSGEVSRDREDTEGCSEKEASDQTSCHTA